MALGIVIKENCWKILSGAVACAALIGNEACTPMHALTVSSNTPSAKLRYVNSLNDGNSTILEFRDLSSCPKEPTRVRVAETKSPSWISNGDPEISTIEMLGSSPEPQVFVKERVIPAGRPDRIYRDRHKGGLARRPWIYM
jgi:hypothetical protein